MNKQTVYKGTGHKSWDGKFKIYSGENTIPQFANEVESVYVLTEQEMKERDTQKLSDGWDACAKQLLIDISKTFLNPSNQDKAFLLRDAEVFQAVGETILNFPIPDKETFINQQINKQP